MAASRLVGFLLLGTALIAAEAQERQRTRGPIKSIPVGADVKRDLDFACPEEFGYYPHPSDCSQYYVCVFGGALLESCTGGLMYSHELQTCDWPRNVGCEVTSAAAQQAQIEPQVQRQSIQLTTPRARPNPVITSRGQPKRTRDELQQQLFQELDELPPAEEAENDRQQRVYRGQPSNSGAVQRDRDGYSQILLTGRSINANIIPAAIDGGKIGAFSFGTQVDQRRQKNTEQQNYKNLTIDRYDDRQNDSDFNYAIHLNVTNLKTRKKREASLGGTDSAGEPNLTKEYAKNHINFTSLPAQRMKISRRSGDEEENSPDDILLPLQEDENEDTDSEVEDEEEEMTQAESHDDRGKRQIKSGRYIVSNGARYEWPQDDTRKYAYQSVSNNPQGNIRYISSHHEAHRIKEDSIPAHYQGNNYFSSTPFPDHHSSNGFLNKLINIDQPFKPSSPDPYGFNNFHNFNQIITKSPPISAIIGNNNPFASLAGGFYNNAQHQSNKEDAINHPVSVSTTHTNSNQSLTTTSANTEKPFVVSTLPQNIYTVQDKRRPVSKQFYIQSTQATLEDEFEEESDDDLPENSEEEETTDGHDRHIHSKPNPSFYHQKNRFTQIENPFANPNFDFDSFIGKIRDSVHKGQGLKNQHLVQVIPSIEISQSANTGNFFKTSDSKKNINYSGMSTPRPFSVPTKTVVSWPAKVNSHGFEKLSPQIVANTEKTVLNSQIKTIPTNSQSQQIVQLQIKPQTPVKIATLDNPVSIGLPIQQKPQFARLPHLQANNFSSYANKVFLSNNYNNLRLRPPNFNDDRHLPIVQTFSFNTAYPKGIKDTTSKFVETVTLRPYFSFATNIPREYYSFKPKTYYTFDNQDAIANRPQIYQNAQFPFQYSHSTIPVQNFQTTNKPYSVTSLAPEKTINTKNIPKTTEKVPSKHTPATSPANRHRTTTTTTPLPPNRKPIPKPSPEMNDYYYDEDDYYEPPVKSKYMPSSEVRPQRPHIAQNDEEYEDEYEEEEEEVEKPSIREPSQKNIYNNKIANTVQNKPLKPVVEMKIPVPVMMKFMYSTPSPSQGLQMHYLNKTHLMMKYKQMYKGSGPHTSKPPKYLNQTTLRPYTVRHRLAKPGSMHIMTTSLPTTMMQAMRGVSKWKIANEKPMSMHDSKTQDNSYTKTRHDGKANSIESTDNATPASFSPRPRPTSGRALYNGSQNYKPDQFDAYYALYDEDGELYKDTDYIHQYNLASPRPIVQYRGTPPPANNVIVSSTRRPQQDLYTSRPVTPEDYDDALINAAIDDQNNYQQPIRQSTRGEGNDLGYDSINSVQPNDFEVTSIRTTLSTTSSTFTTTRQTPSPAPTHTEAITPSKFTQRSAMEQSESHKSDESTFQTFSIPIPDPEVVFTPKLQDLTVNISQLAKPFEVTNNSFRNIDISDSIISIRNKSDIQPSKSSQNDETNAFIQVNPHLFSLTTGFSLRKNNKISKHPFQFKSINRSFDLNDKTASIHDLTIPQYNSRKTSDYNSNESSRRSDSILPEFVNEKLKSSGSFEVADILPLYNRPSPRSFDLKQPEENLFHMKDKEIKIKVTATNRPRFFIKPVLSKPAPFSKLEENKINVKMIDENMNKTDRNQEYFDQIANSTIRKEYSVEISKDYGPQTKVSLLPYKSVLEEKQPVVSPFATLERLRNDKSKLKKNYIFSALRPTANQISLKPWRQDSYLQLQEAVRTNQSTLPETTRNLDSATISDTAKSITDSKKLSNSPDDDYEEGVVKIGFHTNTPKNNKYSQTSFNVNENAVSKIAKTFQGDYRNDESGDMVIIRGLDNYPTTEAKLNQYLLQTEDPLDHTTEILRTTTSSLPKTEISVQSEESFVGTIQTQPTRNKEDKSIEFYNLIETGPTTETTPSIHLYDPTTSKLSDIYYVNNLTDIQIVTLTPTMTARTTASPFPLRTSRVNPAIKLAAAKMVLGRRSNPSSSHICSDNSIHQNPKCNEINTPRTNTRGRGTAHFSTSGGSETPSVNSNRGTPPSRLRPTLKPSTSIVSRATEFIDIYQSPPSRPPALYPQPTPDKTAAKCRKDVCLLPDCNCGGKDIPGDLPVESVPQIVLLTFDDSVNDLNKGLYTDLFEKGRVNPNGCPISATFYVSHEWTDYSQVQNLYAAGHEMASHTISHSFGEQFSQKKWNREVGGQREILAAYGGVKLEDVRGMRAPFLSVGGNKMFKMLHDSNFTYDSSLPVYENRPPSWPYTLDYKLFHDCMIPPCPTRSYPGVWEVPMVMWQDLNGGRCSMGDACANPSEPEGVYKMLLKNFDRHYTTNRAPFGLFYHAAWFTQPHHKEGFTMFLDFINQMDDVFIVTNWQALQWVRDPTPLSRINSFQPFKCNYADRPKKCNNPKVCNLWHKSGVRYMKTCQPCPDIYPWTGKTGIRSSRIDNEIED